MIDRSLKVAPPCPIISPGGRQPPLQPGHHLQQHPPDPDHRVLRQAQQRKEAFCLGHLDSREAAAAAAGTWDGSSSSGERRRQGARSRRCSWAICRPTHWGSQGSAPPAGPAPRTQELVDAQRLQLEAHYVQIITEHYDLHMESLRDDGTSVVHHLFDSLFKAWASIVVSCVT